MDSSAVIIDHVAADVAREATLTTAAAVDANAAAPGGADPSADLGVHLRALRSYFKISNHPLADAERAEILSRDFINEARIAQYFLLRCAELSSAPPAQAAQTFSLEEQPPPARQLPFGAGPDTRNHFAPLHSVACVIKDLCLLCSELVDGRRVSFQTWNALGMMVTRELDLASPAPGIEDAFDAHAFSGVPQELVALAAHVTPDPLAADISSIFSRLFRLLELLRFVELAMLSDEPLKQTLPYFTSLRETSQGILDLVGERTLLIEGLDPAVHEQIDATVYAVKMELRKAFEHELVGLAALRHAPQTYAKVENAHGLLRDCFQQSVISLARAFDAQFDGASLFTTFRTKLEQSLLLRDELWAVLDAVRRAGDEQDPRALQTLRRRLDSFGRGSMRYLMYKDWEAFERLVEEVTGAKGSAELQPALHRFHAFLETLFSQVGMRAVLADYPFTPPVLQD